MLDEKNISNLLEKNLYDSDIKLEWLGYGEWVEEPDEVNFEYRGFSCIVLRQLEPYINLLHLYGGYLCGYVEVPKNSKFYKIQDICEFDLNVHGGVTFSGFKGNRFYIGFDCAHSGDSVPSMEVLKKANLIPGNSLKHSIFNPTYKNIAFCIEECKKLVDQIIEEIP